MARLSPLCILSCSFILLICLLVAPAKSDYLVNGRRVKGDRVAVKFTDLLHTQSLTQRGEAFQKMKREGKSFRDAKKENDERVAREMGGGESAGMKRFDPYEEKARKAKKNDRFFKPETTDEKVVGVVARSPRLLEQLGAAHLLLREPFPSQYEDEAWRSVWRLSVDEIEALNDTLAHPVKKKRAQSALLRVRQTRKNSTAATASCARVPLEESFLLREVALLVLSDYCDRLGIGGESFNVSEGEDIAVVQKMCRKMKLLGKGSDFVYDEESGEEKLVMTSSSMLPEGGRGEEDTDVNSFWATLSDLFGCVSVCTRELGLRVDKVTILLYRAALFSTSDKVVMGEWKVVFSNVGKVEVQYMGNTTESIKRLDQSCADITTVFKNATSQLEQYYAFGMVARFAGYMEDGVYAQRRAVSAVAALFNFNVTSMRDWLDGEKRRAAEKKKAPDGVGGNMPRAEEVFGLFRDAMEEYVFVLEKEDMVEEALLMQRWHTIMFPRRPKVITDLAVLTARVYNVETALPFFNVTVRICPFCPRPNFNLGVALGVTGEEALGRDFMNKAKELDTSMTFLDGTNLAEGYLLSPYLEIEHSSKEAEKERVRLLYRNSLDMDDLFHLLDSINASVVERKVETDSYAIEDWEHGWVSKRVEDIRNINMQSVVVVDNEEKSTKKEGSDVDGSDKAAQIERGGEDAMTVEEIIAEKEGTKARGKKGKKKGKKGKRRRGKDPIAEFLSTTPHPIKRGRKDGDEVKAVPPFARIDRDETAWKLEHANIAAVGVPDMFDGYLLVDLEDGTRALFFPDRRKGVFAMEMEIVQVMPSPDMYAGMYLSALDRHLATDRVSAVVRRTIPIRAVRDAFRHHSSDFQMFNVVADIRYGEVFGTLVAAVKGARPLVRSSVSKGSALLMLREGKQTELLGDGSKTSRSAAELREAGAGSDEDEDVISGISVHDGAADVALLQYLTADPQMMSSLHYLEDSGGLLLTSPGLAFTDTFESAMEMSPFGGRCSFRADIVQALLKLVNTSAACASAWAEGEDVEVGEGVCEGSIWHILLSVTNGEGSEHAARWGEIIYRRGVKALEHVEKCLDRANQRGRPLSTVFPQ